MLPSRWPRARAHEVFEERHADWHGAAQDYFGSLGRRGLSVVEVLAHGLEVRAARLAAPLAR